MADGISSVAPMSRMAVELVLPEASARQLPGILQISLLTTENWNEEFGDKISLRYNANPASHTDLAPHKKTILDLENV